MNPDYIYYALWVFRFAIPIVMLAVIILLITQIYFYKWWFQWPRIYIVYQSVSVLLALIGFVFPVFSGGYDVVGCKSKAEICSNDCPACNIASWFVYLGAWTNNIMFCIIATNVLLSVLKMASLRVQPLLNAFYHFCIIVPPVVILIVLESLGLTGYSDGNTVCFFKYNLEIDGLGTNGLETLLLLLPTSLMLIVGFSALIMTGGVVWRTNGFEGLLKQRRLLAFLLLFGSALALTQLVIWEAAINGTGPPTKYVTCEVTNWVQGLIKGPKKTCHSSVGVHGDNFGFIWSSLGMAGIFYGLLIVFFFWGDSRRLLSSGSSRNSAGSQIKISGLSGKKSTDQSRTPQQTSTTGSSLSS